MTNDPTPAQPAQEHALRLTEASMRKAKERFDSQPPAAREGEADKWIHCEKCGYNHVSYIWAELHIAALEAQLATVQSDLEHALDGGKLMFASMEAAEAHLAVAQEENLNAQSYADDALEHAQSLTAKLAAAEQERDRWKSTAGHCEGLWHEAEAALAAERTRAGFLDNRLAVLRAAAQDGALRTDESVKELVKAALWYGDKAFTAALTPAQQPADAEEE